MSKQVDLINHMKKVLLKLFNPNKDGLFEDSFFLGGQFDPPSLIFQEELIYYQYNFI